MKFSLKTRIKTLHTKKSMFLLSNVFMKILNFSGWNTLRHKKNKIHLTSLTSFWSMELYSWNLHGINTLYQLNLSIWVIFVFYTNVDSCHRMIPISQQMAQVIGFNHLSAFCIHILLISLMPLVWIKRTFKHFLFYCMKKQNIHILTYNNKIYPHGLFLSGHMLYLWKK